MEQAFIVLVLGLRIWSFVVAPLSMLIVSDSNESS